MKRKSLLFIIIAGIVVAAGISILVWRLNANQPPNLDYIEEIHMRLDPADIPELKNIIQENLDNYVRERAVFILSDISIRKNLANDTISFLKDVVQNEKNDQVRAAAYASINDIRELYPLEVPSSFDLKIDGAIIQGETISVIAVCRCAQPVSEAIAGIKHISEKEPADDPGIKIISPNPVHFPLAAGASKEVSFKLELDKAGEYAIVCTLHLGFDIVDYVTLEKTIYLRVENTGGSFEIVN
jgi:hypothetical protein